MNSFQNLKSGKLFLQRNLRDWLISIAICAMLVYGLSGIIYFTLELANPTGEYIGITVMICVSNLVNAAGVLIICSLFGLVAHRFQSAWVQHLILSLIFLVVVGVLNYLIWRGLMIHYFDPSKIAVYRNSGNNLSQLYLLCPIVVGNLFFYFQQRARTFTRKITEQEYQLLHLEQLKTRAELEALQAKINPHFLYNSLNSIASLVHDEPDRAERMVVLLSKLFRYTTGMKNRYFNTIADELEMVRTYLDVEQVRFGDRLTYRIDLLDPALKEVQIPQFLLQPLVENAIKHGISKVAGPGAIILRITEENGWLCCRIHDNGPVFPEELVAGYGLQSIQDKLKLLYGTDARLLVENKPMKEVVVQIKKDRLNSSLEVLRPPLSTEIKSTERLKHGKSISPPDAADR
ncbi:sensor histidine kinase [Larkinella terrae]|uniref:Histidine kinase n=1 Tax=Larkinella terrae TaxID=2025311 RepID=A0A7K0EH25_9BACT|nr:histidine kinase [Larkinella terrae]MRS60768.1 histidine kinase [Larkinella terrae]